MTILEAAARGTNAPRQGEFRALPAAESAQIRRGGLPDFGRRRSAQNTAPGALADEKRLTETIIEPTRAFGGNAWPREATGCSPDC